MVLIGAYAAPKGFDAPPHRHAAWKVTYYRTGRIASVVDGVCHDVSSGSVLVLRPNATHEEIAHTAYSNFYLLLKAPLDQPWPARCEGDAALDIGHFLATLLREDSLQERRSPELVDALITAIDVTLRRLHPDQRPSAAESLIRAAEQIFEQRHPERIRIDALATELGVSVSSLRQQFVARRGLSPHRALQAVRVRRALDLLRTSDLTLAVIADRCGFYSPSHLSRVVKAETGSSPGALRPEPA
jgi:AraC-like DNA-binding protein